MKKTLIFFVVLAFLVWKFGGEEVVFPNDETSNYSLNQISVDGKEIFFASSQETLRKLKKGYELQILHKNNFWNPETCAGMSIAFDGKRIYFGERKLMYDNNSQLIDNSYVYSFFLENKKEIIQKKMYFDLVTIYYDLEKKLKLVRELPYSNQILVGEYSNIFKTKIKNVSSGYALKSKDGSMLLCLSERSCESLDFINEANYITKSDKIREKVFAEGIPLGEIFFIGQTNQ